MNRDLEGELSLKDPDKPVECPPKLHVIFLTILTRTNLEENVFPA